jgi:hypothetical protein
MQTVPTVMGITCYSAIDCATTAIATTITLCFAGGVIALCVAGGILWWVGTEEE